MLRMCKACATHVKARASGSSPGALATVLHAYLGHERVARAGNFGACPPGIAAMVKDYYCIELDYDLDPDEVIPMLVECSQGKMKDFTEVPVKATNGIPDPPGTHSVLQDWTGEVSQGTGYGPTNTVTGGGNQRHNNAMQLSSTERGSAKLCEACDMWLNGPTQWKDHKGGRKHKTHVRHGGKRERHCCCRERGARSSSGSVYCL